MGLSNSHVTPKMCSEAVRSAILATAWLLVIDPINNYTHWSALYIGSDSAW